MYAPGDFSFVIEKMEATFLEDAYKAVESTGMWEYVAKDPGGGGFMFCEDPELRTIGKAMKYHDDHSGASFAMTIRTMQYISKNGWEAYVAEYLKAVGKA